MRNKNIEQKKSVWVYHTENKKLYIITHIKALKLSQNLNIDCLTVSTNND